MKNNYKGFGITSLVLGILSIIGSFIPFLNFGSMFLAVIALPFGIITIVKTYKSEVSSLAIAGTVLAILTIIISISVNNSTSKIVDRSLDLIEKQSVNNYSSDNDNDWTKEDFKDIKIGNEGSTYKEIKDKFGAPETSSSSSIDDNKTLIATWGNIDDNDQDSVVSITFSGKNSDSNDSLKASAKASTFFN